jgi:hypothetical protein
VQFDASGSPFVPIAIDWEQYLQTLSSRRRQDYRCARRGLEKLGQVTVEIQSPTAASVDAGLAEAMRVEAASGLRRARWWVLKIGYDERWARAFAWHPADVGGAAGGLPAAP